MASAHPHATGVAMYPALFLNQVQRNSTPRFVRRLVNLSVFHSHFAFLWILLYDLTTPTQMVSFRNGISLSEDIAHLSFAIAR